MKHAYRALIFAAVFALPTTVLAQTPPTANQRALAAGYKALTMCSALHTAREAGATRTPASVEANELVGIYPELQSLVTDMTVQMSGDVVSVAWDEASPARVAIHTPGRGCVIQPMGYVVGSAPARTPQARRPSAPALPTGRAQGNAAALSGRAAIRPAWWCCRTAASWPRSMPTALARMSRNAPGRWPRVWQAP